MKSEELGPTVKSQLDQTMVTNMIQRIQEKLLKVFILFVNFFMLSMFHVLSNKSRTRIRASIVVTLLSSTFVPSHWDQSLESKKQNKSYKL